MAKTFEFTTENTERLQDIFEYLDELRESGVTNMYGAPAYVQRIFTLSPDAARSVTSAWIKTFSAEPSSERAQDAISSALSKAGA